MSGFSDYVRKAPFAARREPSTAEAFKRVEYEVNGLFSFTSFAGESAPRRSSPYGTVGIVGTDGRLRDAVTGYLCGGTAGMRKVKRIYKSSKNAKKLGAVIDFKDLKDLDFDGEPTLDDLAAYLRPGKEVKVGTGIFRGDLTSLAGEDGVEYWGWNTQNKNQGLKSGWVFVAVQEVEK